MTDRPAIRPEAEAELLAASQWYDSQQPGMGTELMLETDAAMARICEVPEAHPVWKRGFPFRKRLLKRFPYVLFFRILSAGPEVVAVAHAKRRPGYWLKRVSRDG